MAKKERSSTAPGGAPKKPRTKEHRRKRLRTLMIVLGALVLIRLALPAIVLHFANKTLANMPGYYGHIEDVDLAIYRGAYVMDEFFLDKVDSATSERTPFMASHRIDLSVEWKALLHGSVKGELVFDQPMLRFTKEAAEPGQVQEDTADFRKLLHDFMPLKVNRVEMHEGSIEYADPGSSPPVHLAMTDVEALALNLTNVYDSTTLLPSKLTATAGLYGGMLKLNMGLDPLADSTTFDLNLELTHTDLVQLNDFFKAYAKCDVNKGDFSLYTELATRNGAFKGYVKPVIKDLDVLGHEDRDDNLLHQLWEGIVGTAGTILTNPPEDQVATKVPLEGKLSAPDARTWYAVIELLKNAFIQAVQPAIDQEINIASVGSTTKKEGFFKRLFNKEDDGKDGS